MSFFHNLFNIHDSKQAHEDVYGSESGHNSSLTHEVVAGAAAFEGRIHFNFHSILFIYLFSYESLRKSCSQYW